eukprot:TRINITY_DN11663_c0_g1_i1.p1 TRINITY_DN11663_c0_g1~~TRINITY_DN11663_c0_g1_i1.p1  ORF type:complete len:314 (-),score=41.21 TRINITY_DN11663_c0_g1_i1:227-1168(-)
MRLKYQVFLLCSLVAIMLACLRGRALRATAVPQIQRVAGGRPGMVVRPCAAQPDQSDCPVPSPWGDHHIDGMPRWGHFGSAQGVLRICDYIGTVTFACTGAITAASMHLDLFGTCLVGTITAVGGGTIRDAIFLNKKPFWAEETEYIYMCLVAAGLTFTFWPQVQAWQEKKKAEPNAKQYDELDFAIDTLDALGVGAFTCIGAMNGIRSPVPPLVCIICGMSTGTFGGATRDLICHRPVRIAHSYAEIYATTAAAGAVAYLTARALQFGSPVRIMAGIGATMAMRAWAVAADLKLPTWSVKTTVPERLSLHCL